MRGLGLVVTVLGLAGAGVLVLVAWGRAAQADRARAELLIHIDRGGLTDLARAQAMGRRLVVTDEKDGEAAAALAFVSAMLAVDYGLDTDREADVVLKRSGVEQDRAGGGASAASPVAAAARALILLRAGDREGAGRLATAAAGATPGTPYPLYALARVRSRNGDCGGAARALKAAIVGSPAFMPARVALAEARLDLGDAPAARAALDGVLAAAPHDSRSLLLLDEVEQAVGSPKKETLSAACPSPQREEHRWPPAAIKAGCALAQATRARRAGARTEALTRAQEAASTTAREPRLLARAAQALAQLGAIDRAATILDRAGRLAAPETPALAWAAAAVTLGRGRAASLPDGPAPADPDTHLLLVRVALAAGGVGALANALDGVGERAIARDVDLQLLAGLRDRGRPTAMVPAGGDDPVRAYVDGLAARLDGNIPAAVSRLGHALSGHGDACRAAGEYLVLSRVLKRNVDPAAWNLLRAENASCVNLR